MPDEVAVSNRKFKLEPIDAWTSVREKYVGTFRGNDNRGLTGLYKRPYKNGFDEMYILNNGHCMRSYKYPSGNIPFSSPMLRWRNLFMCGGFFLEDETGADLSGPEAIFEAVMHGYKPLGDIFAYEKRANEMAELANQKGLIVTKKPSLYQPRSGELMFDIQISHAQPLNQLFNLDNVKVSYKQILGFYRMSQDFEKNILGQISDRLDRECNRTAIEILADYDWASPRFVDDVVMTGLIFGYPVESTCAILFTEGQCLLRPAGFEAKEESVAQV